MLEARIVQRLPINLDGLRRRQHKVHAGRLVVRVGPAVDGAALHADVAGFHVDHDAVVEVAVWFGACVSFAREDSTYIRYQMQPQMRFREEGVKKNLPINLPLEQNPKIQTDGAVVQGLRPGREVDDAQHDALVVGEAGRLARCWVLPGLVVAGRELEGLVEYGEVAFHGRGEAGDLAVGDDDAVACAVVARDDAAGVGVELFILGHGCGLRGRLDIGVRIQLGGAIRLELIGRGKELFGGGAKGRWLMQGQLLNDCLSRWWYSYFVVGVAPAFAGVLWVGCDVVPVSTRTSFLVPIAVSRLAWA